MSLSTRTSLFATAALTAAAIATAAPVSAYNRSDAPGYGLTKAPPCTALHARYFNVTIDETGAGNISVDDIGQTSCNETSSCGALRAAQRSSTTTNRSSTRT